MKQVRPLKTELHHWWPRTLAEHWQDEHGLITMVRPNGEMRRAPPGAFGAVTNAYHIKIGGPWDSTFEPLFNRADSEVNDTISWLLSLEATTADPNAPRLDRILSQSLQLERQCQLARVLASLIARSPRTSNEIRSTTEQFRLQFGFVDPKPEDHLVATNQRGLYDAYRKLMEGSGRWAVLYSDSTEFIFGDGFLHNFPASADGLHFPRRCVLPLIPTIAVVYMLPMSYPSEPKLVTIRLDDDEVTFFNEALQAYANEFLFFRSQQPKLIKGFTEGSHRQFKYHKHEWLEEFLDDLSQYNLWGPGGSPSRSEGYFVKSFQEEARLARLFGNLQQDE